MKRLYTGAEAARATGATYRQVDYWASKGWITGEPYNPRTPRDGTSEPRLFNDAHLQRIRELKQASDFKLLPLTEIVQLLDRLGIRPTRRIEDVPAQRSLL